MNNKILLVGLYLFGGLALVHSTNAYSGVCSARNGAHSYNFDFKFSSNENYSGYTTPYEEMENQGQYYLQAPCNKANTPTFFSAWEGDGMTLASTAGGWYWHDLPDNDYLQVASKFYIAGWARTWPDIPSNPTSNKCSRFNSCSAGPYASGSTVRIRVRIKKKFVGASFILNRVIGYIGAASSENDRPRVPVAILRLNATMTVPQSCTFDVGDVIEFNFGEIPTSAFSSAGAGNRIEGKIQTQNIGIECRNIAAQEMMTARLEVTNPNQNIIVSNNPDVGFQLADKDNNVLVPNNINSRIPFKLDQNAKSNFILKGWPVSITGNRPTAGPVNAEGHVRIDFD